MFVAIFIKYESSLEEKLLTKDIEIISEILNRIHVWLVTCWPPSPSSHRHDIYYLEQFFEVYFKTLSMYFKYIEFDCEIFFPYLNMMTISFT